MRKKCDGIDKMARFHMSLLLLSFVMVKSIAGTQDVEPIALGVESGAIPDESLTASSVWESKRDHSPVRGRLNMPVSGKEVGAWVVGQDDDNPWIQAKLNEETWVTGVATQGRAPDTWFEYKVWHTWVTSYQVGCSLDGNIFDMSQILDGNVDETSVVYNQLKTPALCRYVRIYPKKWNNWPALRFEVYGLPPSSSSSDSCEPLRVRVPTYSIDPSNTPGDHLFDLPPVPAENSLNLDIPFQLKANSETALMVLNHANADSSYVFLISRYTQLLTGDKFLGPPLLGLYYEDARLWEDVFTSFRLTYSEGIMSMYVGESTTPYFSYELEDPMPIASIGYKVFVNPDSWLQKDLWAEWIFDVCNMY